MRNSPFWLNDKPEIGRKPGQLPTCRPHSHDAEIDPQKTGERRQTTGGFDVSGLLKRSTTRFEERQSDIADPRSKLDTIRYATEIVVPVYGP